MKQEKSITKVATDSTIQEGRSTAIIAYITLIGLIIAFVQNDEKKNAFANYHIRQSLGLIFTGIALFIVGLIPLLGWLISILGTIAVIILWIMGLMNAVNGKQQPIPLLGNLYNKWLANI
ncbi:hypothetical protein FAZ15_09865 [Sphingobacterium olei]|uniref:DUF4870 domain-containing protein n=1 Tax=Sphingobacterium olei TaxID=2571155 RepID=A0A4U0P2G3_9SPHI|nr:hypothetical protein [Sphingobacterium olei]TJZ61487.1 hypothetical protein FAZ15_09865 [Sphingobacterium olei]